MSDKSAPIILFVIIDQWVISGGIVVVSTCMKECLGI